MPAQRATHQETFLAGDGVRAWAALSVLMFHLAVGAAGRGGDESVRFAHSYGDVIGGFLSSLSIGPDIFFALSGYLVGGPFVRAFIDGRPLPKIGKYFSRRIRRIFPAAWLMFAYVIVRHGSSIISSREVVEMFGFIQTFFSFHASLFNSPFVGYLPHMWTLDLEVTFYLLLPFVAAFAVWMSQRRSGGEGGSPEGRRKAVVAFLAVFGLISLAMRASAAQDSHLRLSLLGMFCAFAPGMALAAVEGPARIRFAGGIAGRRISFALMFVSVFALLVLGRLAPGDNAGRAVATLTSGLAFVIAPMVWQWTTGGAWRVFDNRVIGALGRWSYGFYLWHVAILLELYTLVSPSSMSAAWQVVVFLVPAILLSAVAGALSWRFVEQPAMKARLTIPRPDAAAGEDNDPRKSSGHHFPLVDGLRAVAALSVVGCHIAAATFITSKAAGRLNLGVAVFFAISGFLLYRPFVARRVAGKGVGNVARYARRRVLRIVPAYWLALTLLAIFPGLVGVFSGRAWVYYGFVQVYGLAPPNGGLFPAWSLCIELTFYAFLPVYAFAMLRLAKRAGWRAEVAGLVGLAGLAITMRYMLAAGGYKHIPVYLSLFGRMDWFVPGMAIAVASVYLAETGWRPRIVQIIERWPMLPWAGALVAFGLLSTVIPPIQASPSPGGLVAETIAYGVLSFLLLLPAVIGESGGGLPRRFLSLRPVAWLGLISYGIYLYHYPIAFELARHMGRQATAIGTVGIVIILASLSWYLFENPILSANRRREKRQDESEREAGTLVTAPAR